MVKKIRNLQRWTLDFGFGTMIWDLDMGLDLGLTIFEICLQVEIIKWIQIVATWIWDLYLGLRTLTWA